MKKENQIESNSRILRFLDVHLKNIDQPIDGENIDTEIKPQED